MRVSCLLLGFRAYPDIVRCLSVSGPLALSRLDVGERNREWQALAAGAGNIFGTPEWVAAWWRHYGSDGRLLATACRTEAGDLVGVLPLYTWMRRPVHVVRFIGGRQGDALGPICLSDHRSAVAENLTKLVYESDIGLLIGEHLPQGEGWRDLVGACLVKHEPSPTIALEGMSWDSFLAARGKRLARKLATLERKLASRHRVEYRLAGDQERFEEDLDRLFALHRARWTRGSSFTEAEAFQRDFASVAFQRGWCRLWFLEVDGEPRAASYGFRFAGAEYGYQAGRDPGWGSYSLGLLLYAHVIREAICDHVSEFRLLRGGEEWKYRFATHDAGLETVGVPGSAVGSALLRAARRLPRSILRSLAHVVPWLPFPATVAAAYGPLA